MIKSIVVKQYRDIVNSITKTSKNIVTPNEGWVCTTRKALGMSVINLANRLQKTRAHIYKLEKSEQEGRININTIKEIAEAMNCRLVYAIIPKTDSIEDVLELHAHKKAQEIVALANKQMALEDQQLSDEQVQFEIQRVKKELLDKMPKDFWE